MTSRSIWLPCFKKTERFCSSELKNSPLLNEYELNQVEILKDNQTNNLGFIDQYTELQLKYDPNYLSCLKIEPCINDIVIKNSFWMIVVNHDLSENEIPLIFTTLIDKKSFVKSEIQSNK